MNQSAAQQIFSARRPIGLYVHIPFCVKKCPYCDFNSYERKGGAGSFADEESRYVQAVSNEIRSALLPRPGAPAIWKDRTVGSIFFGGGTPSLLPPAAIGSILDSIVESSAVIEGAEVTVECNPGTIAEELGAEKLSGYRSRGVNRISIGGQSFNSRKLGFLGRIHPPEAIAQSVENIRAAGFTNFNVDLMFGAADETPDEWLADLKAAIELKPPHLSVYSLTIEPGTDFGRLARTGAVLTGADDTTAQMFTAAQELLGDEGFTQYEISNYARPGYECRHNQAYWKRSPYLGAGAGAHSFWEAWSEQELQTAAEEFNAEAGPAGVRWSNIPGPSHYIERIESKSGARQRIDPLNTEDARLEALFLGLRTSAGIDLNEFPILFTEADCRKLIAAAGDEQMKGLLKIDHQTVRITDQGALFINNVTEHLACSLS